MNVNCLTEIELPRIILLFLQTLMRITVMATGFSDQETEAYIVSFFLSDGGIRSSQRLYILLEHLCNDTYGFGDQYEMFSGV